MIKEKKTLLILRVVLGVLLLAGIVAAIVMYISPEKDIDMIDCDVESGYFVVTFSEEVVEADVEFAFYDSHDLIVETKTVHFKGPGEVLRARIPSFSSSVKSYEPLAFEVYYESTYAMIVYILVVVDVILLALFIQTLTMSCKIYDYNGSEILVYAGFMHRYLKVNGVKVDERSTAFTYGTISLNFMMADGEAVWASISRMNRIVLRVNNQILPEVKNAPVSAPSSAPASAPAAENAPVNETDVFVNDKDVTVNDTNETTSADPFNDDNL